MILKKDLKYKYLSKNELIINLDRLSRFKLPQDTYKRVFYDVLLKCLINPKYGITELDKLPAKEICRLFKIIWNSSVEKVFGTKNNDENNILKKLCIHSFKNIDEDIKTYINTDINIKAVLENIDINTAPKNLINLKLNINKRKEELTYPVNKLIISEGITEEILLPVFAKKLGFDFDKKGIYIIGAGGKSKSPALYLKFKNKLKVPIILLFDNDAKEIYEELSPILLTKDKIIMLKKGEFEDILSKNLIKRALNNEYETILPIKNKDLNKYTKMCDNLHFIYRTRQLGEFKKAKFAQIIAKNLKYKTDITCEIKDIISCINNV